MHRSRRVAILSLPDPPSTGAPVENDGKKGITNHYVTLCDSVDFAGMHAAIHIQYFSCSRLQKINVRS